MISKLSPDRRHRNRGLINFTPEERKQFFAWDFLLGKELNFTKKYKCKVRYLALTIKKSQVAWPDDMVRLELIRVFVTKHSVKLTFHERKEVVRLDII